MSTQACPRQIKLVIDSRLDNVPLVGASINKLCSTLALSEVECCDIEICVVEAANNAVIHAYEREKGHDIEVVFSIYHDRIVIEIKDRGKSLKELKKTTLDFDPQDVPNLPVSGMGLFIINKVMNKVRYSTDNDTNILTLTKLLNTEEIKTHNTSTHC